MKENVYPIFFGPRAEAKQWKVTYFAWAMYLIWKWLKSNVNTADDKLPCDMAYRTYFLRILCIVYDTRSNFISTIKVTCDLRRESFTLLKSVKQRLNKSLKTKHARWKDTDESVLDRQKVRERILFLSVGGNEAVWYFLNVRIENDEMIQDMTKQITPKFKALIERRRVIGREWEKEREK